MTCHEEKAPFHVLEARNLALASPEEGASGSLSFQKKAHQVTASDDFCIPEGRSIAIGQGHRTP